MNSLMKQTIAGGALALTLALSPLTATPSFAAAPIAGLEQSQPPARRDGRQRIGAAALAASLIRATADVTGLTPQEVVEQLSAGKTLTQIASDNGQSEADVIAAARNRVDERIEQAIANGRLTRQQADRLLQAFDANAASVMNDPRLGKKIEWARRAPVAVSLVKVTADVTGLTPQQVVEQLRAGKTIAQIAAENGKTADDIMAEMRKRGQERLNQALERAEEMIDQPLPTRP